MLHEGDDPSDESARAALLIDGLEPPQA